MNAGTACMCMRTASELLRVRGAEERVQRGCACRVQEHVTVLLVDDTHRAEHGIFQTQYLWLRDSLAEREASRERFEDGTAGVMSLGDPRACARTSRQR